MDWDRGSGLLSIMGGKPKSRLGQHVGNPERGFCCVLDDGQPAVGAWLL